MKILIKVTKEVLKRSAGCGRSSLSNIGSNCAVALAVVDIFPNAWVSHAFIHLHNVNYPTFNYVCDNEATHSIPLPRFVSQFISDFDSLDYNNRINLPEISFEIEVPQSVIDKIGISEAYRILSESKTLELVAP